MARLRAVKARRRQPMRASDREGKSRQCGANADQNSDDEKE
ncbi:MAG: hypothetical protein ACRCXM_02445 [Beijerinckiaceae bacterium]